MSIPVIPSVAASTMTACQVLTKDISPMKPPPLFAHVQVVPGGKMFHEGIVDIVALKLHVAVYTDTRAIGVPDDGGIWVCKDGT